MRTTISIQDQLLKEAKSQAQQRNCTLGEVIEEALRLTLVAQPQTEKSKPAPFITFKGQGVHPGVDVLDSASLIDAMEEP